VTADHVAGGAATYTTRCAPYAYKLRPGLGCGGADKWTIQPEDSFPRVWWEAGSGGVDEKAAFGQPSVLVFRAHVTKLRMQPRCRAGQAERLSFMAAPLPFPRRPCAGCQHTSLHYYYLASMLPFLQQSVLYPCLADSA